MEKKTEMKNPLHDARIFLEYIEKNSYDSKKREEPVLKNKFKNYSDVYYFCLTRHLIKVNPTGKGESIIHEIEITIEGSEFLEKQRSNVREKRAHKFQKQLVIASIILAIGVSYNAVALSDVAFKEISLPALLITILALTFYVVVDFIRNK